MPRPDQTSPALTAPLDELIAVLLRQFRRPLAAHGVDLTDIRARTLAEQLAHRQPFDPPADDVRDGLVALVAESEAVLARLQLTFPQALDTTMDQLPGWETTSDFLELANEKSNAELRIASGAALAALLGDVRYAGYLTFLAARPDDELDTIVARRTLTHISGIAPTEPNWLEQVTRRLNDQSG